MLSLITRYCKYSTASEDCQSSLNMEWRRLHYHQIECDIPPPCRPRTSPAVLLPDTFRPHQKDAALGSLDAATVPAYISCMIPSHWTCFSLCSSFWLYYDVNEKKGEFVSRNSASFYPSVWSNWSSLATNFWQQVIIFWQPLKRYIYTFCSSSHPPWSQA